MSDKNQFLTKKCVCWFLLFNLFINLCGCHSLDLYSNDFRVRLRAIERTGNQHILAQLAMKDRRPTVAKTAVSKLTDQDLLINVALKARWPGVAKTAASKLTDHDLLVKVASEGTHRSARIEAVKKLTDQQLLVKVALGDSSPSVRAAAVRKLADQQLLVRVAFDDSSPSVRRIAAEKINNEVILLEIARNEANRHDRLYRAASKLPIDNNVKIARLKLALQNPIVLRRLGNLFLEIKKLWESQSYSSDPMASIRLLEGKRPHTRRIEGETIQFRITREDGIVQAFESFSTSFPSGVPAGTKFIEAEIDISKVIGHILIHYQFSDADILELSTSADLLELREAAVWRLNDQLVLAKFAMEDKESCVRIAAVEKLTDLSVLEKIGREDVMKTVREAAEKRLTDIRYRQLPNTEFAGGSQEDRWHITASGDIIAHSYIDLRRGPQDTNTMSVNLPYSNGILESVTLGGTELPYRQVTKGQYEIELALKQIVDGQTNIEFIWTFPLRTLKQVVDGHRAELRSLIPVVSYKLTVILEPDCGFEYTKDPGRREFFGYHVRRTSHLGDSLPAEIIDGHSCELPIRKRDQ